MPLDPPTCEGSLVTTSRNSRGQSLHFAFQHHPALLRANQAPKLSLHRPRPAVVAGLVGLRGALGREMASVVVGCGVSCATRDRGYGVRRKHEQTNERKANTSETDTAGSKVANGNRNEKIAREQRVLQRMRVSTLPRLSTYCCTGLSCMFRTTLT